MCAHVCGYVHNVHVYIHVCVQCQCVYMCIHVFAIVMDFMCVCAGNAGSEASQGDCVLQ